MKSKIILCLNFLLALGWAQKVNFLIVQSPQALTLLNAYRQELTVAEKQTLGQWTPFQLQQVVTLSDNVTHAYRVKVLDRDYLLLLDSEGQPLNLHEAGFSTYVSRVSLIMDTVRIRPDASLELLNPQSKQRMRHLTSGQKLVRVFRKGNDYYVAVQANPPLFGWVKKRSNRVWEGVRQRHQVPQRGSNDFLGKLQFLVQNKNQTYQKLYLYFKGQQTGPDIPQWKILSDRRGITLTFSQPQLLKNWPQSTRQFIGEVRELARNNGFALTVQNGFTLHLTKRRKP